MAWDARNLVSTRGERVVPKVSGKVVVLDDVGVRLALSRFDIIEHEVVGSLPRHVEAVRVEVGCIGLVERVRSTVSLVAPRPISFLLARSTSLLLPPLRVAAVVPAGL